MKRSIVIKILGLACAVFVFGALLFMAPPSALAQKGDGPYSGSNKGSPADGSGRKNFKDGDKPVDRSGGSKFNTPRNNRKLPEEGPQALPRDNQSDNPGNPDYKDPGPDQKQSDSHLQDDSPTMRKSGPEQEVPAEGDSGQSDEPSPSPDKDQPKPDGLDTSLGGKKSWSRQPEGEGGEANEPDEDSENPDRPRLEDLDDGSSIDA